MTRLGTLITIGVLAVLAVGLAFAFGGYGIIFAGAAGILSAFGVYFTEVERELGRQSYTVRPFDDPTLSSEVYEPGIQATERPWLWKSVVIAFSCGLIVLGFALAGTVLPSV